MAANTRFAVAVHLLVALAYLGDEGSTSEQLAKSVNTNAVVVRRILSELVRAGFVAGRSGRSGGYVLSTRPDRISLEAVYRAVEPEGVFALHRNPENKTCAVSCSIKSMLGRVFSDAEKALQVELKRTRISDLLERVPPQR